MNPPAPLFGFTLGAAITRNIWASLAFGFIFIFFMRIPAPIPKAKEEKREEKSNYSE